MGQTALHLIHPHSHQQHHHSHHYCHQWQEPDCMRQTALHYSLATSRSTEATEALIRWAGKDKVLNEPVKPRQNTSLLLLKDCYHRHATTTIMIIFISQSWRRGESASTEGWLDPPLPRHCIWPHCASQVCISFIII